MTIGIHIIYGKAIYVKTLHNNSIVEQSCYGFSKRKRYLLCYNDVYIESDLTFTINENGELFTPIESVDILFEVSNGGINSDHAHQEIYYKGNTESTPQNVFKRKVAYEGKHLLLCTVLNKEQRIAVTQVFKVKGHGSAWLNV